MHRRAAAIAALSALALGGGGVLAVTASGATGATQVAPYVDLSAGSAGVLDTAVTQGGLRMYTAAFVIGNGCTPIWGDAQGIDTSTANARIARAQSEGATTIISFGGAAGAELAQSCTDTGRLTAAYQSVVDHYRVNSFDFDVEGAAIADPASISRRYQAIRALKARNSDLQISLTIPVLASGPDANGAAFLRAARDNGVTPDVVNIMTMDYGGPVADMGAAAISAARATVATAAGIWPGFGYGKLGITPMIGQNDSAGEVFTQTNARAVADFARANGVGRLSFWSIGRDQPCAGGPGGGASPSCSSVAQRPLEFTALFQGSSGGSPAPAPSTPPTTPTPAPSTTPPPAPQPGTSAWQAYHAYTSGTRVTYAGHVYTCRQSHTSLPGWEPPNTLALWLP